MIEADLGLGFGPALADAAPRLAAAGPFLLRHERGHRAVLPVRRWHDVAGAAEGWALDRAAGPALDVGCGPGRITQALVARGIAALGVDVSAEAVRSARLRGVAALRRSIFDPLPGAGRWASALLLDGNIGIGGEPLALLGRIGELLRPDGRVLVELAPPGTLLRRFRARVEWLAGATEWFPWAEVGADRIRGLAEAASFVVSERGREGNRWFARLDRP